LWKTLNVNYGRLAINISATELSKKNFRGRMLDFCQTHSINPKNVEIEVIEIAKLINTSENQLLIRNLNNDGFVLALDDFGKGFSNIDTLSEFNVHKIKLDKSLIDSISNIRTQVVLRYL